jgi:hypothetical protein
MDGRVLLNKLRIEKNKSGDRDACTRAALECAKEVSQLLKAQVRYTIHDKNEGIQINVARNMAMIAIC